VTKQLVRLNVQYAHSQIRFAVWRCGTMRTVQRPADAEAAQGADGV
jgi:hypothetical protein